MKLFLIDGHSLIFRMYYAFLGRPMVNSKGQDTSIIFGFTKYLLEMILKEQPSHIAVSFDPPGGTFRNQLYPEYKANRAETPQLVIDALEPLTRIVQALGIPVLMIPGFEADDVIGSAALKFAREGFEVYMVTPDKDYGQLIGPSVHQYKPGKGGAEPEVFGPAEVCAKYGIDSPAQVIDVLTICGDTADNVPGVKGVGEVGASKLLQKYGSVERIYDHLDELTPAMRAKFEAAREHIALSRTLVTIKTDIPIPVGEEQMRRPAALGPEMAGFIDFYEMRSLSRLVAQYCNVQAAQPAPAALPDPVQVSWAEIEAEARAKGVIAFSADLGAAAVGAHWAQAEDPKALLEDAAITKRVYELKAHSKRFAGPLEDVQLMHYVLDPEKPHSLEALAKEYLGVELTASEQPLDLFSTETTADPKEPVAVWHLAERLARELEKTGATKLYKQIEAPLEGVLARMEEAGVRIDLAPLREFTESLRARMYEREAEVRRLSGDPSLNVASPKQLGEVLYEKMKLVPGARKPSKGSWPTDEETLLEIDHPIVDAILDYRGTRKLLSTYIEPIPGYVRDGRVHTTFNQALTATGRMSSSNPNLQNIPVRTEDGREIRRAFSAPDGWVMMSADYSQIELRVMAHMCADPNMLEAFRSGQDVHSAMAAKIFSKPLEEVTSADRRVAKTANFGIMYGISAFGLAQRLKCPRREASQIIEDYFTNFPLIRKFIDDTLREARACGYVQTLFGRRRYVPALNSTNANLRAFAERNAVNAPIQGTAADIIKMAMIGVDRALREEGLKARMVLQIHDELLLEVPEGEIEAAEAILRREMEGVVSLSVPLTVECNYGKDWLEAH